MTARDVAAQLAEALKPFADIARAYAADAPEWTDRDAVKAIVNIGDLRAVVTSLNAYEDPK